MPLDPAPKRVTKRLRLLEIMQILRDGESSVHDIGRKLYPAASEDGKEWRAIERAIQRDLNDLELWEPAFEKFSGRPPRYRINTIQPVLYPTETLALHAAARLSYQHASGEAIHHQNALRKLEELLPEHIQSVLGRSVTDLGKKRLSKREGQALEQAVAAWLEGHPLRFEYQKPGSNGMWRTNVIETYIIEAHPQNLDLYVVGKETSFHHDIRTFKLSRMYNLQVQRDATYRIPDTFNPREFFHVAFRACGPNLSTERIQLRFRKDAAYRILEGGYANMTEPIQNPDGSVETILEAPVDSSGLPREALPFIYSFGANVEVLGPTHIREHWLGELREAAAQASRSEGRSEGG